MEKNSYKTIPRILLEGIIIGVILVIIFWIINLWPHDHNKLYLLLLKILTSGFIFHILCEYTGLNIWYVNDYNEIIKKNKL
jgi:hypothetical protein